MREKMFPKILSKAIIDALKEQKILKILDLSFCRTGLFTVARRNALAFPHCIQYLLKCF